MIFKLKTNSRKRNFLNIKCVGFICTGKCSLWIVYLTYHTSSNMCCFNKKSYSFKQSPCWNLVNLVRHTSSLRLFLNSISIHSCWTTAITWLSFSTFSRNKKLDMSEFISSKARFCSERISIKLLLIILLGWSRSVKNFLLIKWNRNSTWTSITCRSSILLKIYWLS